MHWEERSKSNSAHIVFGITVGARRDEQHRTRMVPTFCRKDERRRAILHSGKRRAYAPGGGGDQAGEPKGEEPKRSFDMYNQGFIGRDALEYCLSE